MADEHEIQQERLLGSAIDELKKQTGHLNNLADPSKDASDRETEKETLRDEKKRTGLLEAIERNTRGGGSGVKGKGKAGLAGGAAGAAGSGSSGGGFLSSVLGTAAGMAGWAGAKGLLGKVKKVVTSVGKGLMPKAAARLAGAGFMAKLGFGGIVLGGVISAVQMASDGIKGYNWGEAVGKDKVAATLGHILGGTKKGKKGAAEGALKGAGAGATIGVFIGGPVGALIGGLAGAVVGGIAGYVGGKAMTDIAAGASNTFKRAFGLQVHISPQEEARIKKHAVEAKNVAINAVNSYQAKLAELNNAIKEGASGLDVAKLRVELDELDTAATEAVKNSREAIAAAIRVEVDKANNAKKKIDAELSELRYQEHRMKGELALVKRQMNQEEVGSVDHAKKLIKYEALAKKLSDLTARRIVVQGKLVTANEKLEKADNKALEIAKEQGVWAPMGTRWRKFKKDFSEQLSKDWEKVKQWPKDIAKAATAAWDKGILNIKSAWTTVETSAKEYWTLSKNKVVTFWGDTKNYVSKTYNDAKLQIEDAYDTMKIKVLATYGDLKTKVSETYTSFKTSAIKHYNDLKTNITNAYDTAKLRISDAYDTMQIKILETYGNLKTKMGNAWTITKTAVTDAATKVETWWTNVKTNTTKTFEDAKKSLIDGYTIAKNKMGEAYTNFTTKFTIENLKKLGKDVKQWLVINTNKLMNKLPDFPSWDEFKALLPQWLTDPIGFFKSWWQGDPETQRRKDEHIQRVVEDQNAQANSAREQYIAKTMKFLETQTKDEKKAAEQEKRLAELTAKGERITARERKQRERLQAYKDFGAFGYDLKQKDTALGRNTAAVHIEAAAKHLARIGENIAVFKRQQSAGYGIDSEEQGGTQGSGGKDKRKYRDYGGKTGYLRKYDDGTEKFFRFKTLPNKRSGGFMTAGAPFIAHEGELVVPSSSGLVLNKNVTQAILKAGIDRYASGTAGGSTIAAPIVTVAPTSSNHTTFTNQTMVTRRALPLVAVS